jgi:hypothetical protein
VCRDFTGGARKNFDDVVLGEHAVGREQQAASRDFFSRFLVRSLSFELRYDIEDSNWYRCFKHGG